MDTQDSVCPIAQRKKTMHDYHELFKLLTQSRESRPGVLFRWTPVGCPEADFCIENKYVEVIKREADGIEFTTTPRGCALISNALFMHRQGRLSPTTDWHAIAGMPVPPVEHIIIQTLEAALSVDSGWYRVERGSIAEKNVRYLGQHGYVDWVCDSSECRFRFTKTGILVWADASDLSDLPSYPALLLHKTKTRIRGLDTYNKYSKFRLTESWLPTIPPFSNELPKSEGSYWYQYRDCTPDLKDVMVGYSEHTEEGNPVPSSKCLGYYKSCGEFIPLFVSEDERWSGPIPQPSNTHAAGSLTEQPFWSEDV